MSSQRSSSSGWRMEAAAASHMEDPREHLARNLVHIRDHQHQPLRSRKRSSKRPGSQCAMRSSGSAELRLHLLDLHSVAKEIEPACDAPFVGSIAHRSHRRDGINRSHVAERVSNISGRSAAVHTYKFAHGQYRKQRNSALSAGRDPET